MTHHRQTTKTPPRRSPPRSGEVDFTAGYRPDPDARPLPARHFALQHFADGSVAVRKTAFQPWQVMRGAAGAVRHSRNRQACLAADFAGQQNRLTGLAAPTIASQETLS